MKLVFALVLISFSLLFTFGQVPIVTGIQILKAEDARRYDGTLETLMRSPIVAVKTRAALAAGRIGDERALAALTALLENDPATVVRSMAAFAIGEIESIKGSNAVLGVLRAETRAAGSMSSLRARLVEAAGKIAAANPKEEKAKELGNAILAALDAEYAKGTNQNRDVVLLGLTAALRAKPEKAEVTVAKFLSSADARIRADAANTLSRIRAKNANETLRAMLVSETDDVARANAARALGAADDKDAINALLDAATTDKDSRVRVSAIRAIGSLKDPKTADKLLVRGNVLLDDLGRSKSRIPQEKSELLEIATALGNALKDSEHEAAITFLLRFMSMDKILSAEPAIALLRVSESTFTQKVDIPGDGSGDAWRSTASMMQAYAVMAEKEALSNSFLGYGLALMVNKIRAVTAPADLRYKSLVLPEMLRSLAKFKRPDFPEMLRISLTDDDVFVRTAAAELLAEQPVSKENTEALNKAFSSALVRDRDYNDALLAIMDAMYKLDKKGSVATLLVALNSSDYLVRRSVFEKLADKDLRRDFPVIAASLEIARSKHRDQVLPYSPASGTKLGQLLNSDLDYRRAMSRTNGSVKAVLTTEKGTFTIVFNPEEAPLTVDNFIKLARARYFNGLEVHRVVPNFVMQDGDPRGDGNGGPGWSIRCEMNMVPYERGAVGMALSGKDTGGSQWFVTHAPQPHLDGGYTVFGHVNETDMKVVDNIVRGDKIISVNIIEENLTQSTQGTQRKKR